MTKFLSSLYVLLAQSGSDNKFQFDGMSKSFQQADEDRSINSVYWIVASILIATSAIMIWHWWTRRNQYLQKNKLFFEVGGQLGLSGNELRFMIRMGKQLQIDNLLMLFTRQSLWDDYLSTLKIGNRETADALYIKMFQ